MPSLKDSVVLVTGANGGIGVHLVHEAVARGARKVYATARNPRDDWDDERIVPQRLDVTDAASVAACVDTAPDVTVLVNNAGVTVTTPGILTQSEEEIRANVETNFLGPLALARVYAPILSASPGSVLVDVHSVLSWWAVAGIYSASKAAMWSATNSLRIELAPAGVHVVGVHMGYVDTRMAAHTEDPKLDPADLARAVYDGVEAGHYEVLADEASRTVRAALSAPLEDVYPQLSGH